MVTGIRLLTLVLASVLASTTLAAPAAGQTTTSCATTAEGHGGTSGLGLGLLLSQESFVEGATVPFDVVLYNRDAAARTLSWGPGETVYSVSVSRDDGTAVDTVSWWGSDGYAVTLEACSQAKLPASSGWNSAGALGDGASPRLFTFTPALTKTTASWTGAGSIQLYREGSSTTSPPPASPQPYSGSSGCSNFLFVTVGTDDQWYRAGETVTMGVYAYNSADHAVTIEYRSGQQYEFRLYDANGRLVGVLPEGMGYTDAIVMDELAPGERLGPYVAYWTLPAATSDSYASGTYFVQGVIPTNPECGAKTTIYREAEHEAPKPLPTPAPFPERPYEYYYEEYRWGDCDPTEIDTRAEWEVCYRASKERTLAVATDAYRYERGDVVTVTFGNPASEGTAMGPFVLAVVDDERSGVFKAEIPEVEALGPYQRARTTWDGRDADGNPVAGGYFILGVYGADGRYGETTISYGGSRVLFEYASTPWDRPDYLWDATSYRDYAAQYEGYAEKWLRLPTTLAGAPADDSYADSAPVEHEGDLFGSLSCDEASASGRFLAFGYDSTVGQINDFTVNHPALGEAAVVFTTVAVDGFVPTTQPPSYGASTFGFENPLCRGPVFLWFGDEQVIDVHNSPTASLGVRSASDTIVTFTLLRTDDTRAETSRDGRRVEVHVGDVSGWLVLAGPGSLGVAGNVVVANLGAGGQVFFQLEPKGLGSEWALERQEILRGIAGGRVAGELNVDASGDETLDAPVVYHPGLTRFETIAATEGRVQLFIEAESTEGQVVVVNVDKRLLALGQGRTLRVLFDGDVAALADDFDDLTGGDAARFLFLIGAESVQVLVFIPHFSPHFITLESAVELVTSPQFLQTLAITAGVAFLIVATAAAIAFRQPRPRP